MPSFVHLYTCWKFYTQWKFQGRILDVPVATQHVMKAKTDGPQLTLTFGDILNIFYTKILHSMYIRVFGSEKKPYYTRTLLKV